MTQYVWHATLDIKWESNYDFGLYHDKGQAKKACQDFQPDAPIEWDNSNRVRSFAPSKLFGDGIFEVTRRPIR